MKINNNKKQTLHCDDAHVDFFTTLNEICKSYNQNVVCSSCE